MTSDIIISGGFFRNEKVFSLLEDEKEIGTPLKWFLRLYKASEEELPDYPISPGGYGVHWNQIDEDLSASGMLNYSREHNTKSK